MLRRDLFRLLKGFNSLGNLTGIKFLYAVSVNKRRVSKEVKSIRDSIKPTDEFTQYEVERIELCKEHSEKDDKGNPVMLEGNYKISSQAEFDKELKKLKDSYNGIAEKREEELKKFEKYLDEEVEINLHLVDMEEIPKEITGVQFDSIFEMMREERNPDE